MVAIPLNYTSEFWELFEATMGFKWTFQTTAVGCELNADTEGLMTFE